MATRTTYHVVWHWKDDDSRDKLDEVEATNAQRAINKVKRELNEEYADVMRAFVPVAVFPKYP